MKKTLRLSLISGLKNHRGVTVIVVALAITMLIGFAALAVDLGYMMVAKNELQNAADAGALAGTRYLYTFEYDADGNIISGAVNEGANQIAIGAAAANQSAGTAVEVNETDVQRGHWSFGRGSKARGFYANDSISLFNFIGHSDAELDDEESFINAIKVKTRRDATPIASFFARIFGYENFKLSADAVAYLGFAGNLHPGEVDQPIVVCKGSITDANGNYSCNIGRMLDNNSQTAGWTSFDQPCGNVSDNGVMNLICKGGNTVPIIFGKTIAVNNGVLDNSLKALKNCWPDKANPWELTLPVIDCSNGITSCNAKVVGAVTVNIVWITGSGSDPQYNDAPYQMGSWSSNNINGEERWKSFREYFNLKTLEGEWVPYQKKTIYFLPDCTVQEPTGNSGGENFNILAKIPVLVK
jgi:hypothetical protein